MSRPDPTGAKSLEEILASIRRSLAEEPARPPEARVAPVQAAQPEPKPASPPANVPTKANGAGLLASKLAAGLNGVSRAPAPDDDLSDLLATEPKTPVPSTPTEAPKPAEAKSDAKDPLWFLTRLSAAAADTAPAGSAARARDAAKAPAAPVEEVKLSRPETLRPSLPPLFGAASEPMPPAAAREETQDTSLTVRTEPRSVPSHVNGEARTAQAEPEVAVTKPAPAPIAQAASPVAQARPVETATPPSETPRQAAVSLSSAPPAAPVTPAPHDEVKPLPMLVAEVRSDAVPESAPLPADSAPVPGPEPVGALPAGALEQVVAGLLEPVIRQWLQSNLPRLIEKAVREEVVRALAAERDAAKV
jgi:cell pole-organizing protein PopZ